MARAMNDYINDAKGIYDGQYATKLADLERIKAERLSDYDNTKKSLDSQYEKSMADNKKDGITRVNNYNNNTLARGMGRSTIATTGIAGIENTTAQLDNDLRNQKAAKIAELLNQRNNYLSDYDRQVRALNAEKQSAINQYAMDMYNRDVDYDRQQALAAAAAARSSYSSSGGSGSFSTEANSNIRAMMNEFNGYMKSGDTRNARDVLFVAQEYRKAGLITAQEYMDMQNTLHDYETNKKKEQVAYSRPTTGGKGTNAINYTYVNGQAVPTNKVRK